MVWAAAATQTIPGSSAPPDRAALHTGEMAEIPEAILDEIKRRIDIAAVIGEHVALKRSGREFLGLCPFHQEKTPSFSVIPERGFFYCFGCNTGGNVFTFVMRVTGMSFSEAARALAGRCGVELPQTSRAAEGLDRLVEINALAAQVFEEILRDGPQGEAGRSYLERRGISRDAAARLGLGFAPGEVWVGILEKRGAARRDLAQAGLLRPGRDGREVPLFRQRLIFPIRALGGRIVAFGGRLIGDELGPKYINTPETPLYRTGHHPYGLEAAREAARAAGRVVLVEGYMDASAVAQAGIGEVAAVLGTAVTPDQLRLARRFANRIVVCFDGDAAGRRAALRVFPLCADEVDLWPDAAFLPPGEDPDSLLRGGGPAALEATLAAARPLAEVFLDDLAPPGSGIREQTLAAQRMADVLTRVREPRVRDKLVRGAAFRLGVSPAALLTPTRTGPAARPGGPVVPTGPAGTGGGPATATPPPVSRRPNRNPGGFSLDAEIVELALCDAEIAARVRAEDILLEIESAELRDLLERILDRREQEGFFEPAEMLGELPGPMAERVARRLGAPGAAGEMREAAGQWFERRTERAARQDRALLLERLRAAQASGDAAGVDRVLEALRRDRAPLPTAPGAGGLESAGATAAEVLRPAVREAVQATPVPDPPDLGGPVDESDEPDDDWS